MTPRSAKKKRLEAADWQAVSDLAVRLTSDPVFVRLLRQLRQHPTHHNHLWNEPDDFGIAIKGCKRCEAFFSLPFRILENLK
jgi:hypothetical protein